MGRSMKGYLWNNPLDLKKPVKKVKLHKSLYGLKQYAIARAWNKTANYTFEQLGFKGGMHRCRFLNSRKIMINTQLIFSLH